MESSQKIENALIIAAIIILVIINAIIIIFGLHISTEDLASLLTTGHVKTLLDWSMYLAASTAFALLPVAFSLVYHNRLSTVGLLLVLIVSSIASAFIPSVVLVTPVNDAIFDGTGSMIQSKYLKTTVIAHSSTFEKIDGDIFIVNGRKYRVSDTHEVKTKYVNNDRDAGIKIYRSDIDQKKMPKPYIKYLNFLAKSNSDNNPLPSANQSSYTKVIITQSLRK